MKPIIYSILLFSICPALAGELPVSTSAPAGIAAEAGKTGDFAMAGSTEAQKAGSIVISDRMMKQIRELEKEAVEEKGQDDAALERLGGRLGAKLAAMPLDRELLAAVKDETIDWRLRYLMVLAKSYTAGEKKIAEYSGDFVAIMQDKKVHERVRAISALTLLDISKKNKKVKNAFTELAKAEDTPGEVLKAVMTVVGYGGIDDADVLMRLTERGPKDLNEVGINLNAIRALGESKDPRAFGYLVKIFDESVPDSFFNSTAIATFWPFIRNPETRDRVKPVIVPRLLKLLEDRSLLGVSRDDAAAILAELQIHEAVEPLLKWFLPANGTHAKNGGGGNRMDVLEAAEALTKLGAKQAIPFLEKLVNNFSKDSRWSWGKPHMVKAGQIFPDDHPDYKHLRQCLNALKKDRIVLSISGNEIDRAKWLEKKGLGEK